MQRREAVAAFAAVAPIEDCTACPRLASHLAEIRHQWPDYHARPVVAFGDPAPRLLVVGLAPGLHGANRTGRPFTGDHAGILLYATLHRFGFANQAQGADPGDGLQLRDCRITNAVKCLPPQNAPMPVEIRTCNSYLKAEISALPSVRVVLALGAVAHGAVLRVFGHKAAAFPFAHGARHDLSARPVLFDSYHCSRYNTQTRRLTPDSFAAVFAAIRHELDGAA